MAVDYATASQRLISAVQELSMARTVEEIQAIVRSAARQLTGADGATFVLKDVDKCFYVDEDAIEPLWKGQRFPLEACISGWAMLNREPAVIPDIYADARIPHDAYRPTFVQSLVMVPIRRIEPVGAIGNYWASHHHATEEEVALLGALADSTAVAMDSVALYQGLERRVLERTAELEAANLRLSIEVDERQKAEERVRLLSVTDELTGLHNRRGFQLLASQELKVLQRQGASGTVLFFDLDGLKVVNDTEGHEVGDGLLRAAADVLRRTFREGDVVARFGGDEFVAFVPDAADVAPALARLEVLAATTAVGRARTPVRMSVGVATSDPSTHAPLDALVARADAAMYEVKRSRRAS